MIEKTLQMLQRNNAKLRLLFKDDTVKDVRITFFDNGTLIFMSLNSNDLTDIPLVHIGNVSSITIYEDEALLSINTYLN